MLEQTASAGSFLLFVGIVILVAIVFTVLQWQWFRWRHKRSIYPATRVVNHAMTIDECRPRRRIMAADTLFPYRHGTSVQEDYSGSFYDEDTIPVYTHPPTQDRFYSP